MSKQLSATSAAAALAALALMLSADGAEAKVKIIHVAGAIAAHAVPNPPASEEDAARWHGAAEGLPRILRLRVAEPASRPPAVLVLAVANAAVARCEPAATETGRVGPWTFYGPADQRYGGRIYFQTPAWDSSRFLPQAAWSERPDLWTSKVQWP